MRRHLPSLSVLLSALALWGCQTPIVDKTGPLAVRSVSVSARPSVKSVTDLVPPLQAAAAQTVVGYDPSGTPADIRISIDQVTYKDPMMSLLVGSTNSLNTTVTVTSESGAVLASFPHATLRDVVINGIVGAVIAASQDQAEVDRRLVAAYADELRIRIYGPPGHKAKAQVPAVAAPTPAPAAPAAPSASRAAEKPAAVPTS